MPLTVQPDPIETTAKISHDHDTTTTVKISGGGTTIEIEVPPNTEVDWTPPAGWDSATFKDGDCPDVFRFIASETGGS